MANSTAKILIVDDDQKVRETTSFLIKEQFGYLACSPESPKELKRAIAFEAFDGALVDFDLEKWEKQLENYKLNDHSIKDGNDIARFYRNIHNSSLVNVYTTQDLSRWQKKKIENIQMIFMPKLGFGKPDMKSFEQHLKPFLEKTDRVKNLNPSLLPADFRQETVFQQLNDYKLACRMNQKWVNFNFEVVGDFSWTIICDRKIDERYYGKSLNGNGDRAREYGIQPQNNYPTEAQLADIAQRKNATPFVVWNMRPEVVEKQFLMAGTRLRNIPEHLQDFVGLAASEPCAEVYATDQDKALYWCTELRISGQIETLKQIYKRLGDRRARERFRVGCEQARLPIIVEMYKARVDEIETDSNIAWVELTEWHEYIPSAGESFDLEQLQSQGVNYKNQMFEYTVYQLYTSDMATSIERGSKPERNPFASLLVD